MKRPHILYLHSHDTGRYIQPYGHAVPTPNLQRLAEQGVLFRRNFCAGPTCSASRAALLTGQSPHSCGMIGLAHRGFKLNDYNKHIIHTLREAGYGSTLVGVQHVARPAATDIGYDRMVPHNGTTTGIASAAEEFLREYKEDKPFFLSVGFIRTHRKFPEPGPDEDPRFCLPPAPLPDTPRTRYDMARFQASARELDVGMGSVLGALDRYGLADNTLVICTTDHGIAFPHMKCNLTDHGIGVMLMMRGPGGFEGGKVCDAMVSHVDLFPTICDLLEIAPPAWLEGKSMMPLIRDEAREINDEIFAEVTYHAAYEPMRCVRTQRWKYIRRYGDRRTPVLPNCDDGSSKDELMDHGLSQRPVGREQLFDLVFDPNETNSLVADADHAAVLDEMRGRLDAWMRRTDDPLRKGDPVPAPSGAQISDPDGVSPQDGLRTIP